MNKHTTNRHKILPLHSGADAEAVLHALAEKHFGSDNNWNTSLREFMTDISASLRKNGADVRAAQNGETRSVTPYAVDEVLNTLKNLQSLVVKLRKEPDGSIVYALREGRFAGSNTTDKVMNRPVHEFLNEKDLQAVMPHVQRAFDGEIVQFEFVFEGRYYLRFFAPVVDGESNEITEVVGSLTDITPQKEIESQLRSSENLFRKLIDSVPIGIIKQEIHADGKIHDAVANAEFQRISGYSVSDFWNLSAQHREELIHPADRERARQTLNQWAANKKEGTLHLGYQFRHGSGEYRNFENYLVKFYSDAGNLVYVQAVLDVTERTTHEQQLRHLASYLEQSVTPIFELNKNGAISYLNHAAQKTFSDLSERNLAHPVLHGIDELMSENPASNAGVPKRVVTVDAEFYEQHVYYMPEANVFRVFCHNITTLKRAEEELRETLEKERAVSLLRSTFIDTISHEFRTPLTGINTSAELLQRYDAAMTHEQRMTHIESIRSRVQELVNLIARFTTQSSLRNMRDSFVPSNIDIISVVRKILEEMRSFATDRKQKLVYELPPGEICICGDERLLRHAIRNILLNAIQYSEETSQVDICMRSLADSVEISVTDHGVGIPDRELELLFTPFFRGTNVGKVAGSGLGISIAKEFIELHKGSVSIESKVGAGTRVVFSLPICRDANT